MRISKQLLLVWAFYGCITALQAQKNDLYAPCDEMPLLMEHYEADVNAVSRFYSPAAAPSAMGGRRGGSFSSPEKRNRLKQLNGEYLDKIATLNFQQLSQECKVDYILFKRDVTEKLRQLTIEEAEYNTIAEWFPFTDSLYALEKLRRRGIQPNAQKVAAEWAQAVKSLNTLLPKLKAASLEVAQLRKGMETVAGIKATLKSIFDFYNGYDPMFSWWVPQSYEQLDKLLTEYATVFDKKQVFDSNGIAARKPVGHDELMKLLQYEMIPYTPEELLTIANEEFAWCEKEMKKASAEMGFGDNWKAAVEKVKDTYVPPGKQPEAIFQLYNESVAFLKKHDLITIPPLEEEVWGMYMMSPERQRTNAFFTGGNDITISYPTNTMDFEFALMSMRGNNPNFSRATVHHELIAGHNMQYFSNARNRTYRNYTTPFWMEGWALYWELILWDMKFQQTPEHKVGMLFWHMHRCARIIFSFQFHTGKWTPQQCIDFLVDKVGHERKNAESEIRGPLSSNANPLYQVGYLTGGRQFYALKRELVDDGKWSYKKFHDAVMKLNSMPVEMIRAILTNAPLNKEYTTQWKFYEKGKVQ